MSIKFRLAKFISRTLFGYEVNILTFSQAGEDLIIRNFFYERLNEGQKGFFVDIGAFHPYKYSNTYYLYRGGWRGISIDARPNSMKLFNQLRPEDTNLEIAISDTVGESEYYDFGDLSAGINTMSTDYIDKLGTASEIKESYNLKTRPLDSVFDEFVPDGTEIDFMNIDIEGMEAKVLASNNWSKFRPKLIACEVYGFSLAEIAEEPVSKLLHSKDYEIYARVILDVPKVNTVFFIDTRSSQAS